MVYNGARAESAYVVGYDRRLVANYGVPTRLRNVSECVTNTVEPARWPTSSSENILLPDFLTNEFLWLTERSLSELYRGFLMATSFLLLWIGIIVSIVSYGH